MGIIVDLIIIGIILLFIGVGLKKGLAGSLIKLLSFAIALIVAVALYKPVSNAIMKNTQIDENIEQAIIATFGSEENSSEAGKTEMPNSIVENINKEIKSATNEARNQIVENTAKNISNTIINIGSGLGIYIIARFILFIIGIFVNQVTNLPILKQVDKIGGIAYGAIEGIAIVYVILAIISLFAVVQPENVIVEGILKSSIGSMLYNNNLILNILF